MDFELQTICVLRPAYFTIAVLLLLATMIVSGISAIIATIRRIRGAMIISPHVRKFHVGVVLVWVMFAAVVSIESVRDRYVLREYEQTTGKVAPALREAMNREMRTVVMFGAGCAVSGLLSMLAWRAAARRARQEYVE